MDELAGKPGFFERIFGMVHRHEVEDHEDERDVVPTSHLKVGTDQTAR